MWNLWQAMMSQAALRQQLLQLTQVELKSFWGLSFSLRAGDGDVKPNFSLTRKSSYDNGCIFKSCASWNCFWIHYIPWGYSEIEELRVQVFALHESLCFSFLFTRQESAFGHDMFQSSLTLTRGLHRLAKKSSLRCMEFRGKISHCGLHHLCLMTK